MANSRCRAGFWGLVIGVWVHGAPIFGQAAPALVTRDDGVWKLAIMPDFTSEKSHEELAQAFIVAHHEELGISNERDELRIERISHSLLGTHYHYKHYQDEIEVGRSELVISVDNDGHTIYAVFNGLQPSATAPPRSVTLSKEMAYDAAWKHLGVTGKLTAQPQADLQWRAGKDESRLVYRISLNLSHPIGAWEVFVDAQSGEIIDKHNRLIPVRPIERLHAPTIDNSLTIDRQAAFADFYVNMLDEDMTGEPIKTADGSALVFLPDPLTVLANSELTDASPSALFEPAYSRQVLPNLLVRDERYHLNGPWVQLVDWSSPATLPSTTTDGSWSAKRGENAFNDGMTYFHLDQNQRYIQSLGFVGERGIINYPIEVDTDGFDGADNSFYDPTTNRIAFGHGCVDDNEDTDVILHEYGHAIQHQIVFNWGGGDSGAIGEGFGDYWATSYRSSLPDAGHELHKVFSWDASSGCWGGRRIDKTEVAYDPDKTYRAHGRDDGFVHDELWSSPLFAALQELTEAGAPRTDVDRIILQSHFGLSRGVTMRDMALMIVTTAQMLHPGGPYTSVFQKHFGNQNLMH